MSDAWSYLPGSSGDAWTRMYGDDGDAWNRLPGDTGDAWTRLTAVIVVTVQAPAGRGGSDEMELYIRRIQGRDDEDILMIIVYLVTEWL